MKQITYFLAVIAGALLSLLIGQYEIAPVTFVVWLWMFLSGLWAKNYMKGLQSPYTGKPKKQEEPDQFTRIVAELGTYAILIGASALICEIALYKQPGTVALAIIIFGLGVKVGVKHINSEHFG